MGLRAISFCVKVRNMMTVQSFQVKGKVGKVIPKHHAMEKYRWWEYILATVMCRKTPRIFKSAIINK
jgi:hypothetical protein